MFTTNLMVESVDKTVEFYRDILGFSVIASVPNEQKGRLDFVILSKDSMSLMLQNRESLIEECPILNFPKVQPSATLYITVDNFDDMYKDIKSKYAILKDIHVTNYGMTEFAIADNNGYVITIAEHKEIMPGL